MWMRIDDGLPTHRKTRAVLKSHHNKTRDAAPLGIWALAGAYAGKHGTDGWVPEDELDRWDDDWQPLVDRLIRAGFWWPYERDGEPGYGFNDWHDYNDPAGAASKAGSFGNHVRWHVNEGKVDPACEHCPKEPSEPEEPEVYRGAIGGRSGGDIAPDSGGESHFPSGAIALPLPEPLPEPEPEPRTTSSDKSDHEDHLSTSRDDPMDRFDEFWNTYANKVGRKKSEAAYKTAVKKPGVTEDLLIAAAAEYVAWCNETGTFIKNPLTWLNGEHWTDERTARQEKQQPGRAAQWLQLAADLGNAEPSNVREIGPGR